MKVPILLEELQLEYRVVPVAVAAGEQFSAEFRRLSPNSKVPVIVDRDPADAGAPIQVFESGAIMLYLAEKCARLPTDTRRRAELLEWLFWQAAGLSPMSGQAVHFLRYAPAQTAQYARKRYWSEVNRLYGVLERRLAGRDFICGEYGIADIAAYAWCRLSDVVGQDIETFQNIKRWRQSIDVRPAVVRAYKRVQEETPRSDVTPEEFQRNLFGATARSLGLILDDGPG